MSNKWQNVILLIFMLVMFSTVFLHAQLDQLHGDQNYSTYGVHSGNQVRTSFWNDGQIGYRRPETQEQVRGEWPINSGNTYIAKISSYFGSEVRTDDGIKRAIVSEANGTRAGQSTEHSSGDASDEGAYWSMTPLPGFYNENPPPEEADQAWVAMSHKDWSWPNTWPDKMDDATDPGWHGFWNGYFGKDFDKAADQESYYMMDDYNNIEFPFYPDSTDLDRRGLGLRVTVRGMQWNQAVVEDALFWLFSAENIGTHLHDKMGFGINCGPDIGGDGDSGDDNGSYDLVNDLAYQFDQDFIGEAGWAGMVGLLGLAFLETPGNPHDGIDNDGDGADGSGPTLTEDMFGSKTVNTGDPIILINYDTFERTQSTMPAEGQTITYLDRDTLFVPGELVEIPNNLIDDNLNGIIDENNGRLVGTGAAAYLVYLFEGLKYIDYFTGDGSANSMIDERRDDGIDNNNDWNPLTDDVGLDGLAGTGDEGEGDGFPSSGFGTDRPGEPNIDKTDIDESDQIGLTSFILYNISEEVYALNDDEKLWTALEPGYLDPTFGYGNTDIMMGCSYFPLVPDEIKQLSLVLVFGTYSPGNLTGDLVRNKIGAQAAYKANYQFAKAPPRPEVSYTAEDKRITLYWDDVAESANDPLTGHDFEGYRIYRSTDAEWKDMAIITDAHGTATSFRKPVAQFDLVNGIEGFSQTTYAGIQYYLGAETGIVHKWVDTTIVNGQDYFYAVTSYDHGLDSIGVFPSECSRYLSVNADGTVEKDDNVVIVRAEAPAAGFKNASADVTWQEGSTSNGNVVVPIENNMSVQNGTYRIVFEDTLVRDRLWDIPNTKNFSLIDVTNGAHNVLLDKSTDFGELITVPEIPGTKIMLENKAKLDFNVDSSSWNNTGIYSYLFRPAYITGAGPTIKGTFIPADYSIEFGSPGMATSTPLGTIESVSVNFKVVNITNDDEIDFVFHKRDGTEPVFSAFTSGSTSDRIYFLEKNADDSLIATGSFELSRTGSDSTTRLPGEGDIMTLKLDKPFLSNDVVEFTTKAAFVDETKAATDMDNIKVVPNPYIVSNSWEPKNPYTSGRGPRELHFIHLPQECTIKIFNIQGQLVQTLEHSSTMWDGTEIWDMLTKDKLDIAYGVYIYHVDAPGIGKKIGKFAVIK